MVAGCGNDGHKDLVNEQKNNQPVVAVMVPVRRGNDATAICSRSQKETINQQWQRWWWHDVVMMAIEELARSKKTTINQRWQR